MKDESVSAMVKGFPSSFILHPSSFASWLDRAVVAFLFLMVVCAPHSIAATQGAWLGGMVVWVVRFFVRPRPVMHRTPVDYALLGFFILTFVSTFFSYDFFVSVGKLRAASLFTIVYLFAENVRSRRLARTLALALVASCMLNVLFTFGARAVGRGVKVEGLSAESPLYAAGVREGDTLLGVDAAQGAREPADLERAITVADAPGKGTVRWPDGKPSCVWDEQTACVRVYRVEVLPAFAVARARLLEGQTPEARLGITRWAAGRDERATGFYGQYATYAEVLQLVGSLALGLLVARRFGRSRQSLLLLVAIACMIVALLMTLTRASWLAFLLSAFTILLVGAASRRTLLITAAVALPLVLAGLFILQQKRGVGFIDLRDGSTSWRIVVYRDSLRLLVGSPRHMLVGVGMDSLKGHWREWGMFEEGRIPWGHLHSTPLQIAFERGVPTLLCWLVFVGIYARTLWRMVRERMGALDWVERGTALGALGGLVGFLVSGLVHYNFGDSEVVMVFYLIMGLALALERLTRETRGAKKTFNGQGREEIN